MKKILFTFLLIITYGFSTSKDLSFLNGYKYIIMPPLSNYKDVLLSRNYSLLQSKFRRNGFKLELLKYRLWDKELKARPGLGLYSFVSFFCENSDKRFEVNLELVNIRLKKMYQNSSILYWEENYFDSDELNLKRKSRALSKAINHVFVDIDAFDYSFNKDMVKEVGYNEVTKTDFTYQSIKKYFKQNRGKLDPIEGFYIQSEYIPLLGRSLLLYKVAVVRDDYENKYNMIVISSLDENWKEGEVKAVFNFIDKYDKVFHTEFFYFDKNKKEIISEFNEIDSHIIIGNGSRIYRKIYSY